MKYFVALLVSTAGTVIGGIILFYIHYYYISPKSLGDDIVVTDVNYYLPTDILEEQIENDSLVAFLVITVKNVHEKELHISSVRLESLNDSIAINDKPVSFNNPLFYYDSLGCSKTKNYDDCFFTLLPGEEKNIIISDGVILNGIISVLSKPPYIDTEIIKYRDSYVIPDTDLLFPFDKEIRALFGDDAGYKLSIYTGNHVLIKSTIIPIGFVPMYSSNYVYPNNFVLLKKVLPILAEPTKIIEN